MNENKKDCIIHDIDVDNTKQYRCVVCGCMFTKKGLEFALKQRFGKNWVIERKVLEGRKRSTRIS